MRIFAVAFSLLLSACGQFQTAPLSMLPPQARPDMAARNLNCLSEAIYFEAGNRGEPGRQAVAHVILNRVASGDFPADICAVISEGQGKGDCQFVYRCDLDYRRFIYPEQLELAQSTARAVLEGETEDPTGGALYFHAAYAAPGPWFSSLERVGNFGGNIFYL